MSQKRMRSVLFLTIGANMTRWRLIMIIMLIETSFIRDGAPQANTSLALIWSTKMAADGRGTIFILYGDPSSYRDQMQRNETLSDTSPVFYISKTNNLSSFIALETDFARQQLYFSETARYLRHGSTTVSGTSYTARVLVAAALSNLVTGLSVDWVSNMIYWSDAIYQRICVIEAERYLFWRPVVESGLTSPQDVAVYPQQGFLFWTDLSPKIERLDLATKIRQTIVGSTSLQGPTTLVIDFVAQQLLWLDSAMSRIGFVNFDGSGLSFWSMQLFSSISSFAIFKDYIFLGDKQQPKSYAYNFTQKAYVGCVTVGDVAGVIDMTVNAPEKQPSLTSPCSLNNGGCNHFCITKTSTESICQCSMGFFLDSDGNTCNPKLLEDNFLLVSDQYQQNIFQVDLGTGEVRAASVTPADLLQITAMDYEPDSNTVYGFDSRLHSIRKVTLADHTASTVLEFQGTEINSLAVDTVGGLLYYVSSSTINRVSLSGEDPRAVVSGDGTLAAAIALDVQNRLMFWSDCSSRRSIEQAQISNTSSHQSVVRIFGLCATAITLDVPNQVIYWADSTGRLEQVSYSGAGRLLVRQLVSSSSIKGLAVDAKFVYISDSNQRQIQRIDRNTSELSNLTAIRFTNPYALALFSSGRLTSTSSSTPASGSTSASTVSVTANTRNSSSASGVGSTRTSTDTTIILAAVICGSFVLIAVIVTLGLIFGRRCKKKPQSVEGTRPTLTSEETQQMDNGGYSTLYDYGRMPTARNVDTVSGLVGNMHAHSLPPYAGNHSRLQPQSSHSDKYMSIYPPTYAELMKSEQEPSEPPPRQRDVTPTDEDDYTEISA